MTIHHFSFKTVHPSWHLILKQALGKIEAKYLTHLYTSTDWLPGPHAIFNAFSLPLDQVNYVLFGESPYPRKISANGYAFYDAAVSSLWAETGLSKPVNRATSLRNFIKMLLVAENLIDHLPTQTDIANLHKDKLVQTNHELFQHLHDKGFLLLNTTPVLQPQQPKQDAIAWRPFTFHVLEALFQHRPHVTCLLLGRIAALLNEFITSKNITILLAEHPYNLSFIQNPLVIEFFKPLHLIVRR